MLCSGLELHHPIMSTLWGHGEWSKLYIYIERDRQRGIEIEIPSRNSTRSIPTTQEKHILSLMPQLHRCITSISSSNSMIYTYLIARPLISIPPIDTTIPQYSTCNTETDNNLKMSSMMLHKKLMRYKIRWKEYIGESNGPSVWNIFPQVQEKRGIFFIAQTPMEIGPRVI